MRNERPWWWKLNPWRALANRERVYAEALDELGSLARENALLRVALREAEAALADIGDADREPGDDLAWCERRAAKALPNVRAALAT